MKTPKKKTTKTAAKAPTSFKAALKLEAEAHITPQAIMAPALSWWQRLSVEGLVRGILLFFAATLPLYYDLSVPEVSGDIRWWATEFFAGLTVLLLLGNAAFKNRGTLSLRWPPLMWIALGLAFWAAISLIDALNWTRGIVLIKALYCQLILMAVVYHVANPGFGRKLLWALVLPLLVTSVLGMWQFQSMSDQGLQDSMQNSWVFYWFWPLVSGLDWLAQFPADWLGWGERQLGVVGVATGYFLQSAVPGSTFANKNLAGSWTAMMLPIALYLLLTAKRWPAQALASVLLGLGSVFLVYSRARASWVALFAAMMTLAALVIFVPAWRKAVFRHLDFSHIWWLMLPVAMLLHWGGDKSPVVGSYAIDRSPAEQVAALAGSSWNEIGGRLAYNLNSTVITKDYWFNGVGLGSFYTIYPPYFDAIVVTPWNSYNVMARPQRTHTDMMQAFDEMGIPGGILYVGLFVCGIAMALRMAGRTAGAFGGYIIGAGMMTMVLALTMFLEWQNMLAMPEPWNFIVQLGMLLFIVGMVFGAIRKGWQVQEETAPADDVQLMGLMAGIAVLCIAINALMDFPMQLPTAPAAATLLLGVICSVYAGRNVTAKWGPKLSVNTRRAGPVVLFVVLGFAWYVAMIDSYKFREGNILLKAAMVRIYGGVNDDKTIELLQQAWATYPLDQRIQEHIGVAYANYNGSQPVTMDDRIRLLEWVATGDPWGANHMINLSGLYLQKAEPLIAAGRKDEAQVYLDKAEALFTKMKRVAGFSHFTWGIGGMLRTIEGKPEEGIWMFRRALAIEPGYIPAQVGLQRAISISTVKPVVVKDALTGR